MAWMINQPCVIVTVIVHRSSSSFTDQVHFLAIIQGLCKMTGFEETDDHPLQTLQRRRVRVVEERADVLDRDVLVDAVSLQHPQQGLVFEAETLMVGR